ncbi:hypothetical protein [Nocardia blacklockiae]|uniref:hypothetical protein n=1 Tax=Nocardia blacklockiae TaxID=480036 RepID=UPI00189324FF|nr:hypothetical protein [Nocardia blacklockiae]MBF6173594.1 hypothetical protein [Nocardia blacklockiae]
MEKKRRPRAGRSAGRSPEVVARLERLRQQTVDRRAVAREKEKTVTSAVRSYISAWHAITLIEQRRDREISALRQQIDDAAARAAAEIGEFQRAQADTAATIQTAGHSDSEIAELLEITPKQVRQLLVTARNAGQLDGHQGDERTNRPTAHAVPQPIPLHQSAASTKDSTDASPMVPRESGKDDKPTERG